MSEFNVVQVNNETYGDTTPRQSVCPTPEAEVWRSLLSEYVFVKSAMHTREHII